MTADDLKQLKELASERWDDRWTITQKHFADGTTKQTAWRTFGPVETDDDGQVFDVERIQLDGDEVLHDRVHQRNDDVVEILNYEICDPDDISGLDTPEHTKK